MARKPRLQFEGALYHVTTRGNRRERIVGDEGDYRKLEETLLDTMKETGVLLYAWCLMPNHVHLLIETPKGNLAGFMQRWLTRYAGYFNWRYELVGHVFQGRYNAKLCQRDAYLKQLIRYVHLNPYNVKSPVLAAPGQWPWCSHRFYSGAEPYPEGCRGPMEEALRLFGEDAIGARKDYAQFLADGLEEGDWQRFFKEGSGEILGDKAYLNACQNKQMEHEIRLSRQERKWSVRRLLEAAESHLHLSRAELTGPCRTRAANRARQAVVYVGRIYGNISAKDMALELRRDPSAISQMIRRSAAEMRDSWEVAMLLKTADCQFVRPDPII